MVAFDELVSGLESSSDGQRRGDVRSETIAGNEREFEQSILRDETSFRSEMSTEGKILFEVQFLSIVVAEHRRDRTARRGARAMSEDATGVVNDQRSEMTVKIELIEFDLDILQSVTIVQSEKKRRTRRLRFVELRPVRRMNMS